VQRWLVNGELTDSLKVSDRGLQYGDGLFETIAVRGGECRFFEAHLERLERGCERLGIPVPARELLRMDANRLIGAERFGTLKIIVTRGVGERGYAPPAVASSTRLTGFDPSSYASQPGSPIRARFCVTRIGRNASLAGLKTLNRLEQVLARSEWDTVGSGIAEGLMLDDLDHVVCGTMSNIFVVSNGQLVTPLLAEAGVAGIMRRRVIEVAGAAGLIVKEKAVTKADVVSADGLFVSNALMGIRRISELDGVSFDTDPLFDRLRALLAAAGVEECEF